jgi:hypothetical protein
MQLKGGDAIGRIQSMVGEGDAVEHVLGRNVRGVLMLLLLQGRNCGSVSPGHW